MLLLVLTLTYEVIARYLLQSPTIWAYDTSYMLTSLFVILTVAHLLQRGEHVRVDVLSHYLPPRLAAGLEALLYLLLFFPFLYILLSVMPEHVAQSWRIGERHTAGVWLPPIYPFKTWIMVGMFLLGLQALVQFLRALGVVLKGDQA
ncbi:TRAP transporter small permease subunit [Thermus thermamylovorans]|uniref:TRAP transporter small permease subunit n=1 Tax=Thermus thermamylovorans TaxID=2509362 RepID=UPI00137559A3|nr:TRAP transporter small permease subunit [Thermus thermamylovorans]